MEVVMIWVLCGILGAAIGSTKNRPWEGLLWGGGFGCLGLIVIALREPKPPPTYRSGGGRAGGSYCPSCGESGSGRFCRSCGSRIDH